MCYIGWNHMFVSICEPKCISNYHYQESQHEYVSKLPLNFHSTRLPAPFYIPGSLELRYYFQTNNFVFLFRWFNNHIIVSNLQGQQHQHRFYIIYMTLMQSPSATVHFMSLDPFQGSISRYSSAAVDVPAGAATHMIDVVHYPTLLPLCPYNPFRFQLVR